MIMVKISIWGCQIFSIKGVSGQKGWETLLLTLRRLLRNLFFSQGENVTSILLRFNFIEQNDSGDMQHLILLITCILKKKDCIHHSVTYIMLENSKIFKYTANILKPSLLGILKLWISTFNNSTDHT